MGYSSEMLLESNSGFMMPFALDETEQPQITLAFGNQVNPHTGQDFYHTGIDMLSYGRPLFAMATGIVVGAGTDAVHDNYIICKYNDYEVKYGHIVSYRVKYGDSVVAGQEIGQSGQFFHLGVKFKGKDIDPLDFLKMIYTNILTLVGLGVDPTLRKEPEDGVNIENGYEQDKEEITQLMERYFAAYITELKNGTYVPMANTEASLKNIFRQGAEKNHFYEEMPDMSNPLGLNAKRSEKLIGKVQNTLITDFLAYLSLRHNIYLSSWDEDKKKSWLTKLKRQD